MALVGSNGVDYKYNAYGEKLTSNNTSNPISYRGYYYDTETGLYYLKARYYDPTTGQFTQEDTVQDDNLQYNLYGYCSGNPVLYVDPSGHCVYVRGRIVHKTSCTGKYSRTKAIEYAKKWWNGFNPEYDNFSPGFDWSTFTRRGGDCANFVSQCLFAGGFLKTDKWHSFSTTVEEWHGNHSVKKTKFIVTPAWCLVKEQFKFLKSSTHFNKTFKITKNSKIKNVIKNKKIKKGDVMYLGNKEKGLYHATIIRSAKNGKIKYMAHTSARENANVYEAYLKKDKNNYAQIVTLK